MLAHLVGFIVGLIGGAYGKPGEKDLQIALLRHQLRVRQCRSPRPPRLSPWEKLTVAVLVAKLHPLATAPRARPAHVVLLVQPETVLKWHRELGRRKWTIRRRPGGGQPPIGTEVEALLLRLAREHPRLGLRPAAG